MTKVLPFLNDPGIEREWVDNEDGTYTVTEKQDCSAILERNKAMATYNDGYTPSREMRRVASIPITLIHQWKVEKGIDVYNPAHANEVARLLDDPEYLYLRTAPGRLGRRQKMI